MKVILNRILLPTLAILGVLAGASVAQNQTKRAETGTLETLIVASGNVTMDLDLNRLNGIAAGADSPRETLRFQAATDSFFSIFVFNNQLRGARSGSIGLIPQNSLSLPAQLSASLGQLILEKTATGAAFDIVVRDEKTGFVFFNIEGNLCDYDAAARSLQIQGGRLLLSEDFAKSLGRPAEAGAVVGGISITASMRSIEIAKVVNGINRSVELPSAPNTAAFVPGPDVIVGDLSDLQQFGSNGSQVGLAMTTVSCNAGSEELNWFGMPATDHPLIPQNLYRMKGGANNNERFEQIGQSWLKHAFLALQENFCGFGCSSSPTVFARLGKGCSDPYTADLNADPNGLGSRAWVNPFTGAFPGGVTPTTGEPTAQDHSGHSHSGVSHRLVVEAADLDTNLNAGATYYAESVYITPHEYSWCQSNPGQCNMYNNASYRHFVVSGTTSFSFIPSEPTVRTTPAIYAWTGATVEMIEPEPGVDGRGFVACKVTGPVNGMWHYEYAINNQNLDRAIQSFSVPPGCGTSITNLGFHAPRNEPGSARDGTVGDAGFSNAPWTTTQTSSALTWNSETFAQNPNANAIRWGTLYNFRFDSNRPPQAANATIGFFKTGSPITVGIQGPSPACNPPQLAAAVSRKTHGGATIFDVNLPITGNPGIECRTGGASGDHQVVATFAAPVTLNSASISSGTGTVSSTTVSGNEVVVNLTSVANAQTLVITLLAVNDGSNTGDVSIPMAVLLGDTTANSAVNSSDISLTKSQSGQAVSSSNFRSDLTVNGSINSSDISLVKSKSGTALP